MEFSQITEREKTIARRYAAGETYTQIASGLYISPSTVRNHISNIYRKLSVNNKPQLLRALSRQDLTAPVTRLIEGGRLPTVNGASIAVLPLQNSGNPAQGHLVDGETVSIHNYLTRHPDLFVSGRGSCDVLGVSCSASDASIRLGVQYIVQGCVQIDSGSVQIHIDLVEGSSGTQLISQDFEDDLGGIAIIETDIAASVAGTLSLKIDETQYELRKHLSSDQLLAYDWRLRGNRNLEIGAEVNLQKARYEFGKALEIEPGSAAAFSGLSMSYGYECDQLLADNYSESLARHLEFAETAINLEETDSRGHYAMGCALSMCGQYQQADTHSVRAVELNPSEYHNLCCRGYTLMALGDSETSVAYFNESLRRNPLAPNSCLFALGLIEYLRERYGQAAYAFPRLSSNTLQKDCSLAAAYGQLGYSEVAQISGKEFQGTAKQRPGYADSVKNKNWRQFWKRVYAYIPQRELEHILEGISKSGLPV